MNRAPSFRSRLSQLSAYAKKRGLLRLLMPPPAKSRHWEYSMLFSEDGDVGRPSEYLFSIALHAISEARQVSLNDISNRMKVGPYLPNIWPGEHYRLLAGLVKILEPSTIVEIGTGAGLSSLSMLKYQPVTSKLTTFDLIPWTSIQGCCLLKEDFEDGRLEQETEDISDPVACRKHSNLLRQADLIFVDGPKDGVTERKMIANFDTVQLSKSPLVVFDDIRLWNMLKIWRELRYPKLDLTSFGHWSGTGIVHWKRDSVAREV